MAQVEFALPTVAKLALLDDAVPGAAALIRHATTILEAHPLIGRPVELGLRELVISSGKTGYVALYRFRSAAQLILILAVRHQREAGY